MNLPKLIQGGMGVAISDWRLAKAVSQLGQLGVVSGTGISRVMASRLMDGDLSGNVRRALANFSLPEPVQNIIDRYYTPGGKSPETPYKTPAAYTLKPPQFLDQVTAIANFVEVFLAKEGHYRHRRHQPAGKSANAQPGLALRRNAGWRGCGADGRGHPDTNRRNPR